EILVLGRDESVHHAVGNGVERNVDAALAGKLGDQIAVIGVNAGHHRWIVFGEHFVVQRILRCLQRNNRRSGARRHEDDHAGRKHEAEEAQQETAAPLSLERLDRSRNVHFPPRRFLLSRSERPKTAPPDSMATAGLARQALFLNGKACPGGSTLATARFNENNVRFGSLAGIAGAHHGWRAVSSAGRALCSHRRGYWFESSTAHQFHPCQRHVSKLKSLAGGPAAQNSARLEARRVLRSSGLRSQPAAISFTCSAGISLRTSANLSISATSPASSARPPPRGLLLDVLDFHVASIARWWFHHGEYAQLATSQEAGSWKQDCAARHELTGYGALCSKF